MNVFETVVKRVVGFSQESFEENKKNIVDFFHNNEKFQLSVLTSSRSLYQDIKKNKKDKITTSLEKYFIRSHFNPVPFGIFSSVGILNWGENTEIKKSNSLKLSVKYDNSFLSTKVNEKEIFECLNYQYCSNPSIHFINEQKIGFYKSKIQKNSDVEISYVEVDYDENLNWLVDKFKNGAKLNFIIEELIKDGFEKFEIETYLLEIIDIGLIISDFLFSPLNKKFIKSSNQISSELIEKNNHQLNSKNEINSFAERLIKEQDFLFEYNSDQKASHSIDSYETETGILNNNIKEKIIKFINFTTHYNTENRPINDRLSKFADKISIRYNDGFIPLIDIFNPYSGLKYSEIISDTEISLHKDILFKIISSNEKKLILNYKNFNSSQKINLPPTFSVIFESLKCKSTGNEVVFFKGIGGSSAINIISRFDTITNPLCEEIVKFENEFFQNKIVAEVNCIGNLQTLNISPIKHYFKHSIPINTTNSINHSPIFLSDLFIHLNGNKISLVSKKYKKQVIPRLMSSINFKMSDSEVYKFLIELESQNQEFYGVNFNVNNHKNFFKPIVSRVYLDEGIILCPAQLLLIDNNYDFESFLSYLKFTIAKFDFTKKIIFADLKGELVLDIENINNMKLLFDKLKDRKYFYVSECLYDLFYCNIEDQTGNFAHELIASVKNTNYVSSNFDYSNTEIEQIKSNITPITDNWLYLELYCNSYAESDILKYVEENVLNQNKSDLFFFVRYDYPENHLRVRFKTKVFDNIQYIINILSELKKSNMISKYIIVPYEPEIHRYGGIEIMEKSELIFDFDSKNVIKNVISCDLEEDNIQISAILKILEYLKFFNYNADEMILYCENKITIFSKEFELNSDLRKDFNKNYADIKFKIMHFDFKTFLSDEGFKSDLLTCLQKNKTNKLNYSTLLIHMSMNRHFNEKQRFNEFKTYYLTKNYLNQLKYTNRT